MDISKNLKYRLLKTILILDYSWEVWKQVIARIKIAFYMKTAN